jgi:hypothetical protein
MNTGQTKQDNETKKNDDILKPLNVGDLIQPEEELQETSPRREWQIRKLQEKLGVSRDIAEKMVDESGGEV